MSDVVIYDASGQINDTVDLSMGRTLNPKVPPIEPEDAGKVLTAGSDGKATWEDVPEELPEAEAGDAGKVLTLDSELDPVWSTPEKELPAGAAGDASKVLTLNAELEPVWASVPNELPLAQIPGDQGKVLTVGSEALEWNNIPLPATSAYNGVALVQLPAVENPYGNSGPTGWGYPHGYNAGWTLRRTGSESAWDTKPVTEGIGFLSVTAAGQLNLDFVLGSGESETVITITPAANLTIGTNIFFRFERLGPTEWAFYYYDDYNNKWIMKYQTGMGFLKRIGVQQGAITVTQQRIAVRRAN